MRRSHLWVLLVIAMFVGSILWAAGGSSIKDEVPYYLKKIARDTATVEIGQSVIKAEIARSDRALAKGLSGRDSLPTGKGMLFEFDDSEVRPFTMRDMKFPLDIVWINEGVIVYIAREVQPGVEIVDPGEPANYVLEVNSRESVSGGWEVGDTVAITFDKTP